MCCDCAAAAAVVVTVLPRCWCRYSFQNQPRYKSHLQMNKLFDQDSVSGWVSTRAQTLLTDVQCE
jgi:hypothetical protein